jgi:membrane protein
VTGSRFRPGGSPAGLARLAGRLRASASAATQAVGAGQGPGQQANPRQKAYSAAPRPRLGWKTTLARVGSKFARDRCSIIAGSLAYHWFLALFPAVIAAIGVVSLVHVGSATVKTMITGLASTFPNPDVQQVFARALHTATHRHSGGTVALLLGVLIALWSASGGLAALQTGLDVAYGVPRDRSFVTRRLRSLVLMAGVVVLGGIPAALIVVGPQVDRLVVRHLGIAGTAFPVLWTIARWAVTIAAVSLLFSFFYYYGPKRDSPKWQWVSPGGVVGTAIFLLASLGFSFYVAHFGSYSETYGTFAGVAILIFWLYLIGVAVLFGAELNAEAERQAGDSGTPASASQAGQAR